MMKPPRESVRGLVWCLLSLLPLMPSPARAQLAPGQVFVDVPPPGPVFDATSALYQLNVTAGCDASPDFCPALLATREQMAVFVVRAWSIGLWNDPEAFRTEAPISNDQYFADVPAVFPNGASNT